MDFQYGAAVIVILLGLGLTQIGGGEDNFFVGAGWGTLVVGCIWVLIRVRKEFKKR
ncbi:MAG: hypothetical protein V3V38_00185 [Nitrosopumilaceae archaeon]|jgi:hypothetical protein